MEDTNARLAVVMAAVAETDTKMKLGELYDQIDALISRHGESAGIRDLDVVFRLENHSIGPVATANITDWSEGFDWDSGKVFLHTDRPLYHALPYTRKQMKEGMEKTLGYINKLGSMPMEANRCWKDGYRHGFDVGVQSRFAETHPPVDGEIHPTPV